MHVLQLRCTVPYMLGNRKVAVGEVITWQDVTEQDWMRQVLNWTAFQPIFVEVETNPDADALVAAELTKLRAAYDELKAHAEAIAKQLDDERTARIIARSNEVDPSPHGSLAAAIRQLSPDDLANLPGIGPKTAPKLAEWAATYPLPV